MLATPVVRRYWIRLYFVLMMQLWTYVLLYLKRTTHGSMHPAKMLHFLQSFTKALLKRTKGRWFSNYLNDKQERKMSGGVVTWHAALIWLFQMSFFDLKYHYCCFATNNLLWVSPRYTLNDIYFQVQRMSMDFQVWLCASLKPLMLLQLPVCQV